MTTTNIRDIITQVMRAYPEDPTMTTKLEQAYAAATSLGKALARTDGASKDKAEAIFDRLTIDFTDPELNSASADREFVIVLCNMLCTALVEHINAVRSVKQ